GEKNTGRAICNLYRLSAIPRNPSRRSPCRLRRHFLNSSAITRQSAMRDISGRQVRFYSFDARELPSPRDWMAVSREQLRKTTRFLFGRRQGRSGANTEVRKPLPLSPGGHLAIDHSNPDIFADDRPADSRMRIFHPTPPVVSIEPRSCYILWA